MFREDDDGWSNPKVLIIFALIFLCGLAAGSAITRTYLHSRIQGMGTTATMEAARHYGVIRLKTELGLTPDQEKTIMQVLDDYGKYYQNIEDEREDVAEHGRRRILDTLTPDQQARFNRIFRKH
ncbi:MAG TPA: hypothetical protein VK604_23210 [Bryobacteraceae bacterium]|nr:hypothetical protein [Bryobacteraceae bacterium]